MGDYLDIYNDLDDFQESEDQVGATTKYAQLNLI